MGTIAMTIWWRRDDYAVVVRYLYDDYTVTVFNYEIFNYEVNNLASLDYND